MYICAEMYQTVGIDELAILRQDAHSGGIGVFLITGEMVGAVTGRQPEGCVDFWAIAEAAQDERILARAAIVCGRVLILTTDSKKLARPVEYRREEVAGYGRMVAVTV